MAVGMDQGPLTAALVMETLGQVPSRAVCRVAEAAWSSWLGVTDEACVSPWGRTATEEFLSQTYVLDRSLWWGCTEVDLRKGKHSHTKGTIWQQLGIWVTCG